MLRKIFGECAFIHRGRIWGAAIGLLVAVLFLTFGFFKTLFIILCMGIGFFIGQAVDNRSNFEDLKHRYFR